MAEKDELRTEFPQIYPHFYHILHWSSCNLLEFILFFLTWLLQRWQHSELLRIEFTNSFCFQQNSTDNAFVKKVHFPLPLMPVYRHPIREGNGTPLQYSCLENPTDGGAWWAAIHGVAKSQTWLSDFTFTLHFHALEKETATHSSVLAWRIPWAVEPGGLPSMGSHRVRHDWSDSAAAASGL